jgi:hypothetical protein
MSETCQKCGWPKDAPAPCWCGRAPRKFHDGWCGTCPLPDDKQADFELRVLTGEMPAEETAALESTQPHTSRVGLALRARPVE